jgi:putative hydrolase of the HAD superfamily
MTVRAVLFDVGGVLSSEDEMPGHLVEAFTFPEERHVIDHQIATGQLVEAQFRATLIEGGASADRADALMAEMWDWYCGIPDEELLAWAADLSTRVRVGIISNSADGARREEEHRYGLSSIFEHIVYSHEVGLAKPDSRIYALACDRVGVAPHEAVFIDDRPENVAAAREFGMHAIHHTETAETIRAVEELLGPRVQA